MRRTRNDARPAPDPFGDALQQGVQRAIQLGSGAVTAAQVYLFHRSTQARAVDERDDRARRALHAQIRAEQQAGRAGWAPALDPAWLREATLVQVARAWSKAVPYSDRAVPWYEPAAATALRKCEERLRDLHPYAMARYDRLRAEGLGPTEAMQEAAPLFARPAHAHDAPASPRPMLATADRRNVSGAETRPGPWPGGPGDLPDTGLVIAEQGRAATAHPATTRTHRAARPGRAWERDFPMSIRDVLAAVSRRTRVLAPRTAAASAAAQRSGRTRGTRP